MDRNEQQRQLRSLLETGILTQEEFEQKAAMLPPDEPAAPTAPIAPDVPDAPITPAAAIPPYPAAAPGRKISIKTKPAMILYILGVLDGLFSVIMGFVTYGMSDGSWESNITYGGDAYTGIQNAAAQSANNVLYLSDIVQLALGSLLIVAGIALIIFFLSKVLQKREKPEE